MYKKIAVLFAFIAFAPLLYAQSVIFEPAEVIEASIGLNGNARPRIVCDDNGRTHLAWATGFHNNAEIRYARALQNEDFGESMIIADVTDYYSSGGEGTTLRVHGEFVAVGYEDFVSMPNNGVWVCRSTDSGLTWEDPLRAHPATPDHREIQAAGLFPDGRLAQSWLDVSGTPEVAWSRQNLNGSFTDPQLITSITDNPVCECCYPDQLTLDDGLTVLLSYRNNLSNTREIYVIRSTDGGETFTDNTRVDQTNWQINGCPASGGSLTADGQDVILTWMSGAGGSSRMWSARSLSGGETWEPMVELDHDGAGSVRDYPQAALRGDIAVIVWQGFNSQGSWHIYGCVSTDRGANWGNVFPVSAMDFVNQSQPSVAISPNGGIEIVWKDLRSGAPQLYRAHGTIDESSILDERQAGLPTVISLSAYPNPFNSSATISYTIRTTGAVEISILDLGARLIETLSSGEQIAGSHSVHWNPANLASGVYFCKVETANTKALQKLVLLK